MLSRKAVVCRNANYTVHKVEAQQYEELQSRIKYEFMCVEMHIMQKSDVGK